MLLGDELIPVKLVEQAVAEAPDDRSRAFAERHLAIMLLTRAGGHRGGPEDLDRAIEILDRQQPVDDADRTRVELLLAGALIARFRKHRDPADADRAAAVYPAALARLPPSAGALVLTNAWEWGDFSVERKAWSEASDAFAHATAAAEQIYRANVTSGVSLWLKRMAGLGADAAYAWACAGDPMRAALALERSRFRAGSEALSVVRGQLQRLDPTLSARLRDVGERWRGVAHLADAPPAANLKPSFGMSMAALHEVAAGRPIAEPDKPESAIQPPAGSDIRRSQITSDEVRDARGRFEAIVDEIRGSGVDDFLASPDEDDLRAVADRVPLVYLAAGSGGGVAAVLRPGQLPAAVALGALTAESVRQRVEQFRAAYGARADDWRC